MSPAALILAGTPLDENAPLPAGTRKAAELASVIIGESRGVMMRYLKGVPDLEKKSLFNLDPQRKDTLEAIREALEALKKTGGTALLFSDTGMPVLFDPGVEVLTHCRSLGFRIRSAEGSTSWGMACALSGWEPPFLIVGFPPRDTDERLAFLESQRNAPAHIVLMDTPYRFGVLLEHAARALGPGREAFLAWEITKENERLMWTKLGDMGAAAKREGLEKGEFILVIRGAPAPHQPRRR